MYLPIRVNTRVGYFQGVLNISLFSSLVLFLLKAPERKVIANDRIDSCNVRKEMAG